MNKKIKNATVCRTEDITFKSTLEKTLYTVLKENFEDVRYEPTKYCIVDSFISRVPFYDRETDSQYKRRKKSGDTSPRKLVLKSPKVKGITYTPDFCFTYKDLNVYIEAKGVENDVFPYKKKLFIRYLNSLPGNHIYFEIYTKTQLLQAIEIIKSYESASED